MVVEKSHKNSNEAVAHAKKKAEREAARVANALARQRSQYLILKLQSGFRGFNARKNVWTIKNGGRLLDDNDMTEGLCQLGRSPSSTLGRNPSFMNFTLRFKKLNDISLLGKYPLLTTIDISHNNISSLEALSVMPYLWKVEAGYNAITKAIDFAARPPEMNSEGDESIGSSLRYLDLQYNMVNQLEEMMGRHPLLTYLNLSHNNLTGSLNALRPLQMLRNLDVSFNALTSDWGLAGLPIETLSLEENQLTALTETGELSRLVDLNIQNNKISSLYGLRACGKLLSLDMRRNLVEDIDELCHLKDVQSLHVEENPMFVPGVVMTADEFRLHVVARLQSLVNFDGRVVTTEDKVRAVNSLDFPGHERDERKLTWNRVFDNSSVVKNEKVAHDRESLVDLEFKDHLPAMKPIGSMQGKAPPPPSQTVTEGGGVVTQTMNENSILEEGTETSDQPNALMLKPSIMLNNSITSGGDDMNKGSMVCGTQTQTGTTARRSRASEAVGGRKAVREDLVARGLAELKHFAVVGTKPKGAEIDFPPNRHHMRPQPFEAVLEVEVIDAVTGEVIPHALVSLHSGSGPRASTVEPIVPPQVQPTVPGLGKSPSLPCSNDKWAPSPLVINRATNRDGLCEVRVDAIALENPNVVPSGLWSEPQEDVNQLQPDAVNNDDEDDGSITTTASNPKVDPMLKAQTAEDEANARAVPCQVRVFADGYSTLEGPLGGVKWPLKAGLSGGHRKRTVVKLMPLLGKEMVRHHEVVTTKSKHHSRSGHHGHGHGHSHDKSSMRGSWHPTGGVINLNVNVPSQLVRGSSGGTLDVTIPPGAFIMRDVAKTSYTGLARVLVTASFYDPCSLPGQPRLVSNSSISDPEVSDSKVSDGLIVGRIGFAIEAFSVMGEALDLRRGSNLTVSLSVESGLKPQLAISGTALSSIPRLARFDNEAGFWRCEDDGRSSLNMLVKMDGSRVHLPSNTTTPSSFLPNRANKLNDGVTSSSFKCEAPGKSILMHCRDLISQRLPLAFSGEAELDEVDRLVCSLLPTNLIEWTNCDGDFSRNPAAITQAVNTICSSLTFLRRHCHRSIVLELKKKLGLLIKDANESLSASAAQVNLNKLSASLNEKDSGHLSEGGTSVVAAFRARHKAAKMLNEETVKQKVKEDTNDDKDNSVDLTAVWDRDATPSAVELDHALAVAMQASFESHPLHSEGTQSLTAENLGELSGGKNKNKKFKKNKSFDSTATFNTAPLEEGSEDYFDTEVDNEEEEMPTLELVVKKAADQLATCPHLSSLLRVRALIEICPELTKGSALGLLVAHNGSVSEAALKARELASPPLEPVASKKGNQAEVLAPIERQMKLRGRVRNKLAANPACCRAPLTDSEIDTALVKAVSSSSSSSSTGGAVPQPGWLLDDNAVKQATNELANGPAVSLRHSIVKRCIAWPHFPGSAASIASGELSFAKGVSLSPSDQLGLWTGSEVISVVEKAMHGKGKRAAEAAASKKDDKKGKGSKDTSASSASASSSASGTGGGGDTAQESAILDYVWAELTSLDHIKPLLTLYVSSSFARKAKHHKSVEALAFAPTVSDDVKVELPVAEDVGSLALAHRHASSSHSTVLSLFGQQDERPVSSSPLVVGTPLEETGGLQTSCEVVASVNKVMASYWLHNYTPSKPMIQPDQFIKSMYGKEGAGEVVGRAVTHWQSMPLQKVSLRLAKLRHSLFIALESRGYPRVAEEFGSHGGSATSIELLGPSECSAVLESCKHDVATAMEVLLTSPAFLRRCLLFEVKLRSQDSLCVTALGPAAALTIEASNEREERPSTTSKNKRGADKDKGDAPKSNMLSDLETKHFGWIESLLRRHPNVSLSLAEVSRSVEWATETYEALEREEQNIIPIHDTSVMILNEPSVQESPSEAGGGIFPSTVAEGSGQSVDDEDDADGAINQSKHHKHKHNIHKHLPMKPPHSSVPSLHEENQSVRINPIKAAAIRTEAIALRAVEAICSNASILVRHRIAVETSQWSTIKVCEGLGIFIDDQAGELVSVGDDKFNEVLEAERAVRAMIEAKANTEAMALAAGEVNSGQGAAPVTPNGKGQGNRASRADAKAATTAAAATLMSEKDQLRCSKKLHLNNPVSGGLLPNPSPDIFNVDISRVPILFKRSEVRSLVVSKKSAPDVAMSSLHATVKAIQSLHGPNHLRKLGLGGALPLTLTECERALSSSHGDLGPALDLICLDPLVVKRYEVWRVRARVKESLSPEASANFIASHVVGNESVTSILAQVSINAVEALETYDEEVQQQQQVAASSPLAASPPAAGKETKDKSGSKEKGGKDKESKGKGKGKQPTEDEEEAEETMDPDLAELLSIGQVVTIPELTVMCPRVAEENARLQKSKRKNRVAASPGPSKAMTPMNKERPSLSGAAASGGSLQGSITGMEADAEGMAFARFEVINQVYSRSRKLADRAAMELLSPPSPCNYVYDSSSNLDQQSGRYVGAEGGGGLPAVAADGRVGLVGTMIAPSPWLLEARCCVVTEAAALLCKLNRFLPADTNSALENLLNKGRPALQESGSVIIPSVVEVDKTCPQLEAAMCDLAGLLPLSILDEVITRAVLREAARVHSVKAVDESTSTTEAEEEDVNKANDDKAAKGKDDKSKDKGKKAPPEKKGAKATSNASASSGGVKKEKKESEEALFPYPVPPAPRSLAPPIPSRSAKLNSDSKGNEVDDMNGGSDMMRWRYMIYESVRTLIQDDVLFLRQWASRRLQRHLAPRFPFTILEESQLQNALDLCGGHVLKAAQLMINSEKVNTSCWQDSSKPMVGLLGVISGGGNSNPESSESGSPRNPDDAVLLNNSIDDKDRDDDNGDEATIMLGSGASERPGSKSGRSGTGRSTHRHKHHHEPTYTLDEVLRAADNGTSFLSSNRCEVSPMRRYLQDFMSRSAWLTKMTGLNITDNELVTVLLESSAGVKNKCILPEPLTAEAEKLRDMPPDRRRSSIARPKLLKSREGSGESGFEAPPAQNFNLGGSDDQSRTSSIRDTLLHIHPAIAFERLYTLPQVMACTSTSTRGIISYQRKLDLARVLSMQELLPPPPPSNILAATSSAVVNNSAHSEKFEVTVDRLGWWCIGASPSVNSIVRGRLLLGTEMTDFILHHKHHHHLDGSVGENASSNSSYTSQQTSISNQSPRMNKAITLGRNSSTAFFSNSRTFFDPSLEVPYPHHDHSLVARAKKAAGALEIVTILKIDNNAESQSNIDSSTSPQNENQSNKMISEWISPKGSVGVVDPGLDGVVLGFACAAVAGTEVELQVSFETLPGKTHSLRFGPFKVPLQGGDVDTGDLSLPTSIPMP